MKRFMIPVILIALTLALSGCWDRINTRQAAIVTGVGIDYQKDKIVYTAQFARNVSPLEEGSAAPLTENFTARGQTATEAARTVTLMSPVFPLWAHASTIIVGEDLAREDLALLSDFLLRNRNLRPEANMVLAYQDPPEKLLDVPIPLSPHSGVAINQLLDVNETFDGAYVSVSVIDFLSSLITPGIQPVLPQITLSDNQLRLEGTAVFRDRKLVGFLNEEESRGYRWLRYNINRGGILSFQSPLDKKAVSFEITHISSKIRPAFENGDLLFKIEVNTTLNFFEQLGQGELMTDTRRRQLEKLAAEEIKKQIRSCIRKSQDLNSDILGLGLQTHRYYPEYWQETQENWSAVYPRLRTDIKVKSRIEFGYLLKRSVNLRN